MKIYKGIFNKIISLENLFAAWDKFRSDKKGKKDVQSFEWNLEQNIFQLHNDLKTYRYKHHPYSSFYIRDPKQRHIHKAIVRDRLLHHAIFNILNPIFEPTFIANSFSCRIGKGTHKGVAALQKTAKKVSQNYRKPCFALKCDIKKFFDSVDHRMLKEILAHRIKDVHAFQLCENIIDSVQSKSPEREREYGNPDRKPYFPAFRKYLYE